MGNSSVEKELLPPSYKTCVADNVPVAPGLEQFIRIVGNHEKLHFHSPNQTGIFHAPQIVQIRDSHENPILSIMYGRRVVAAGNNRAVTTRNIMTPNGETLITINGEINPTLSAGDQILGVLEDSKFYNRQSVTAKNVMGVEIFHGDGDNSISTTFCSCCLECGCGCCCSSNSTEITFTHNGVTLGQLKRSTNNSSGNELTLFNSANMDPQTKALLIYAGYSGFAMLFADTKCGRIGGRGACRRICLLIIVGSLLLMTLPLLQLL